MAVSASVNEHALNKESAPKDYGLGGVNGKVMRNGYRKQDLHYDPKKGAKDPLIQVFRVLLS